MRISSLVVDSTPRFLKVRPVSYIVHERILGQTSSSNYGLFMANIYAMLLQSILKITQ